MLDRHKKVERHSLAFVIMIIVVASIGGLFEIAPLFTIDKTVEDVEGVRPYTPLELAGRNIYIREGCYACHSQMIRTLRDEVERYGPYSLAAESQYDHPMLWGSKRTGPDLARVGGKYSDAWHVAHFIRPRDVVPQSNMPSYAFLLERRADLRDMDLHLAALKATGVPYSEAQIEAANLDALGQADPDSEAAEGVLERYGEDIAIRDFALDGRNVSEMDALVAYLQMLGTLVDWDTFQPGGKELE
ncbi:MAG: cytochrome-c oxidase, cbb3-type subunit II [Pseudomonadota bacterium]